MRIANRRVAGTALTGTWTVFLIILTGFARADDDGGVVYLSAYLDGDYFYAPLGNIDGDNVRPLQPRRLNFPGDFRALVELGNHDVSPDGREIVFASRQRRTLDWDIYRGRLDTAEYRVDQLEVLISAPGQREEDPKFSWDGEQVVYKCDGNICLYPDRTGANPVVSSPCELWAPSIDQSGRIISYTKRCGPGDSDKIWYFNLLTQIESRLPEASSASGRFSHYSSSGRLVFSQVDPATVRSNLWVYDGTATLLHDRTESDDDPYPDKHDGNHIAFVGWQDEIYNLFVYRKSTNDSVQLTYGRPVIAPVLFRQQ